MKKRTLISNEKGVALMMVLLIATITLAVTTTMLYMLTQSTRYSGLSKRFATASEAAMAASEVYTEYISLGTSQADREILFSQIGFKSVLPCEDIKIANEMINWGVCDNSMAIDPDLPETYDSEFILGKYKIYAKIVYTFKGNTMAHKDPEKPSGSWRNTCVIHCQGTGNFWPTISSAYVIEVDAINSMNKNESSKLSVLFQY